MILQARKSAASTEYLRKYSKKRVALKVYYIVMKAIKRKYSIWLHNVARDVRGGNMHLPEVLETNRKTIMKATNGIVRLNTTDTQNFMRKSNSSTAGVTTQDHCQERKNT